MAEACVIFSSGIIRYKIKLCDLMLVLMMLLLTRWPLRLFGIFIPLGNVDILNGPFRPPVWVIENFYFDTHYVGLVLKFAKISPKFSQNSHQITFMQFQEGPILIF